MQIEKDQLPPLVTRESKRELRENVRKNLGITGTRYKCPYIRCKCDGFKTVLEVRDHYVDNHDGEYVASSVVEATKYKVNL